MWKKLLIISFYLIVCLIIYNKNTPKTTIKTIQKVNSSTPPIKEEKPIGRLIINKINLNEPLYSQESSKNNVDKHITILEHSKEPTENNSIIFLAAHSGTGKIAYFNRLNELEIQDTIILNYNNITYEYKVNKIWEQQKNGTITVPKENNNQLILTTCSPTKKDKQLIINLYRI